MLSHNSNGAGNAEVLEGWTFDKPWLDSTWRYVPEAKWRREFHIRLLELNESRFWQELDGQLSVVAKVFSEHFGVGATSILSLEDTWKLIAKRKLPFSRRDIRAVWYEGERLKYWIGPRDAEWAKTAKFAVPVKAVAESKKAKAEKLVAAPAKEKASKTKAEKAAPKPDDVSTRKQATLFDNVRQDGPAERVANVLRVIRTAKGRAEVLEIANETTEAWTAALKMLHERNELYSFGAGKGIRYLTQSTTLSLIVQAIKEWSTDGEGLSSTDIRAWLDENAHAELTDEHWKEVRDTLLAQGRILKSGQGRGMRYTVPVVEKASKKGKKA
jgi:hypothetical protein